MQCECEQAACHGDKCCNVKPVLLLKTEYGTFKMCRKCGSRFAGSDKKHRFLISVKRLEE